MRKCVRKGVGVAVGCNSSGDKSAEGGRGEGRGCGYGQRGEARVQPDTYEIHGHVYHRQDASLRGKHHREANVCCEAKRSDSRV